MGGRGASSGTGANLGGSGKPLPFYDRTAKFAGMSLHEFENAIRDKKMSISGFLIKTATS